MEYLIGAAVGLGVCIFTSLVGNFWSEPMLFNLTHQYETAFPLTAIPAVHAGIE